VEGIVTSVVNEQLAIFLEENPKEALKLMKKVILAAEAREAAAKAKKALKDRKSILNSGGLPGKLMDCTSRDRDESELFLVEGQSAGGSAESGRDRMFQAILPLRGKVLNVEKARQEKVLGNEEICNLISAVGVDIGGTAEDVDNRRYGKIVLLTDADVDGQHIRTLLLTFFYRQMRNLVEAGHIYVARPPLFKVEQKKNVRFVQTMEEMTGELLSRGLDGTKLKCSPHAPGGDYTGDRLAKLVAILTDLEESVLILERRGLTLAQLLAKATSAGLPLYRVILAGHEHWFATSTEVEKFRLDEQKNRGHEFVVADELRPAMSASNGNGHAVETFFMQELHEVQSINRGAEKLKEFGFGFAELVPLPHVAGREPPVRFVLENGDGKETLPHLRELPAEVRRLGERGMKITRFKGLGEMDPEELWATTLDPAKRTMIRVQMEDALKAEEMFRTLMGEKVEPRREFIQKHALEVKEIDYHGA
jgi:DNA gyrase subunit B